MVVDTSILVAILQGERGEAEFQKQIDEADVCLMSAVSFVECSIVLGGRLGRAGQDQFDLFVAAAEIEIVPMDREQGLLARRAYRRFGKGNHSAALNFGDCFSYALSMATGEPLLFKGNDFSQTDVACM